jgi:hypothetical protein
MRRTPIARRAELNRSSKPLVRSTPLRRTGKKGRANARANRLLKRECERLQIDRCEFGFKDCRVDNGLTHAHVAKRRKLQPGELETKAALACLVCHRVLDEEMTHAEMRTAVEGALRQRAERFEL